jgi:hypothetical protein
MPALICNFAWKNTLAAWLTLVNPLHLEEHQMCHMPLAICFIALVNWVQPVPSGKASDGSCFIPQSFTLSKFTYFTAILMIKGID